MDKILFPSRVNGTITIPSSKSQTIRALLLATFAGGTSIIKNPLDSQDTQSCFDACRALGATIVFEENDIHQTIRLHAPKTFPPEITIDCGNSGTTMYLAMGLAATTGSAVTFTGDEQLQNRPVGPLVDALQDLGVRITYPNHNRRRGYPPFTVQGPLIGGNTSITCHTSQYLSALLMACPLAKEETSIVVPLLNEKPYVHMTRAWLDRQGIHYTADASTQYLTIEGGQSYTPFEVSVQGDYSSASFFFCAAAISGGCVLIRGLDPQDPQGDKEILSILTEMGCKISWPEEDAIKVCGPKKGTLRAGTFDLNAMPDALPILAVTACFAQGTTMLGNVPQARIKETDRIAVMRENLSNCGASVEEREDAIIIHGTGSLTGGTCSGYDDHRIIMAMAIASLGCKESVTIKGIDAVGVTFPTFFTLLEQISKHDKELTP